MIFSIIFIFLYIKSVTTVKVVVDWCQQTNSLGVVHVFYQYLNPIGSDKHTTKYLLVETTGIFLVKTLMIEWETVHKIEVSAHGSFCHRATESFHPCGFGQACAEQTQSCWGWGSSHHLCCSFICPLMSHYSQQSFLGD